MTFYVFIVVATAAKVQTANQELYVFLFIVVVLWYHGVWDTVQDMGITLEND